MGGGKGGNQILTKIMRTTSCGFWRATASTREHEQGAYYLSGKVTAVILFVMICVKPHHPVLQNLTVILGLLQHVLGSYELHKNSKILLSFLLGLC